MALDFLNKVSGSLSSAGKDISKKAKDAAEVMRLQNEIRANEAKIQEHYTEIGKRYYMEIKDAPAEEYAYLVEGVRKLEERIADDQESLKKVKGMRICPECGAQIDGETSFCTSCGTKLEG